MNDRGQLQRAITDRAWPDVFDVAARLIAHGDEGSPIGSHAHWAGAAAGRLGRWYDAVFYARHAVNVAGLGTDVEALALCNLAYFYVQYGAPESALEAGNTFLRRLDLYSQKSRSLAARVLQHMAAARELLLQWNQSANLYREAARIASSPSVRGVALIDCAYAELRQGLHRLDAAVQSLAQVDLADLDSRGEFAFHVVQAHVLHLQGDLQRSDEAADHAIAAAESVDEPLKRELAMVMLVRARNAFAHYAAGADASRRTAALSLGFEAALAFQQQNQVALYQEAREFLRLVLDGD